MAKTKKQLKTQLAAQRAEAERFQREYMRMQKEIRKTEMEIDALECEIARNAKPTKAMLDLLQRLVSVKNSCAMVYCNPRSYRDSAYFYCPGCPSVRLNINTVNGLKEREMIELDSFQSGGHADAYIINNRGRAALAAAMD